MHDDNLIHKIFKGKEINNGARCKNGKPANRKKCFIEIILEDRGLLTPHRPERVTKLQYGIAENVLKIKERIPSYQEDKSGNRIEEIIPEPEEGSAGGSESNDPQLSASRREELMEWASTVDQQVAEIVEKRALKGYKRFALTPEQRANRAKDKSERIKAEDEIKAILNISDEILTEIKKKYPANIFEKCVSILEQKNIDIPKDLQASLNSNTDINEVEEAYGEDVARAFAVARGWIAKKRSEKLVRNDCAEDIFKKYDTNSPFVQSRKGKKPFLVLF